MFAPGPNRIEAPDAAIITVLKFAIQTVLAEQINVCFVMCFLQVLAYQMTKHQKQLLGFFNSVRPSVCLSVFPSVLVSRPGAEPSPGEIETPGLHHMIA